MDIETTAHAPFVVARIAGDVDVDVVKELRSRLLTLLVDGSVDVLVDLAGVDFIDSSGLGALLAVHRSARVYRGSFALLAPSRPVVRLLAVTALDRVFRQYPTLAAAQADHHLAAPPATDTPPVAPPAGSVEDHGGVIAQAGDR